LRKPPLPLICKAAGGLAIARFAGVLKAGSIKSAGPRKAAL